MPRRDNIRALLQGTIDSIEDSIKIVSPEYEILFVNRATEKQAGKTCDEVAGKLCYSELRGLADPCPHCALRLVMETGQFQRVEYSSDSQDGRHREFEQHHYPLRNVRGKMIGIVEVTREVTEKRLFERQLFQSEKLASLGQLSAAIGHEIRNPLTGIRLGLDSITRQPGLNQEQNEILEAVSQDVRRLGGVLDQLLSFARPKEPKKNRLQVIELIESSLFFIHKQAHKQGVEIKLELRQELPLVHADADQLRQVLLNLFLNALEAMPDGGILRISADRLTHGNRSGVLITVQDTGTGIPEEYREKLFEMFFSTKPSGSGVGLAVSNKIIAEHGGALWVESPAGMGALVNIFLPLDQVEVRP